MAFLGLAGKILIVYALVERLLNPMILGEAIVLKIILYLVWSEKMNKLNKLILVAGITVSGIAASGCFASAKASVLVFLPDPPTKPFEEIGNDVKASFVLKDLAGGSYDALPNMFDIDLTLWEDDLIFDDKLGSTTLWLKKSQVSLIAGFPTTGGWQYEGMFTFKNASNDFTGYGDDYYLEAGMPYQSVPEPQTILGSATALGFGAFFKRKLKTSKSPEKETTKIG